VGELSLENWIPAFAGMTESHLSFIPEQILFILIMRIALINSEYSSPDGNGGIATYTLTMTNALCGLGHTVYVFHRNGSRPGGLDPAVKFETFGSCPPLFWERLYESGPFRWEKGCARALKKAMIALREKEGLDIVEVPDYGGLARYCGDLGSCKVVINFHTSSEMVDSLNKTPITPDRRHWHRFEEKAIKNGDGFRCPSIALKELMCKRYGIPLSKMAMIRNPVSSLLFEKIRRQNAPSSDRIDLLFAGRLEYRKGIEIIARNIKDILNIDPRISLTFAGETELVNAPNFRLQVEHSLSDIERGRIWFLGPVNRSQLAVLYCRSSMLLLPSLFENAPYVLLEAMAAKLPVIAASNGGIPEIIRHRENGLLFPADNLEALCACIREWIDNPSQARSCVDAAYRDITATCAPEKIAAEAIAFYSSLLQSNG
jgi:glycogen(starch) synthase